MNSFFILNKKKISKIISLFLIFILAIQLFSCNKTEENKDDQNNDISDTTPKQVWIYADMSMIKNADKWLDCLKDTDVVILNIAVIKKYTKAELDTLSSFYINNNVSIAVECNGLVSVFGSNSFHTSEKSMAYNSVNHPEKGEYTILSPMIEKGVKISYLIFKDPVTNALYTDNDHKTFDNRYMSIAEASAQTVEAMKFWREHIEDVQFVFGVDYYNYGWKNEYAYDFVYQNNFGEGDLYYELDLISAEAEAVNIPLYGVLIHNPYDYAMGRNTSSVQTITTPSKVDWMKRIRDLENECNTRNINFMLTLDSIATGNEGDNLKYFLEQMRYINKYAEAGGTPDVYAVKSGKSYPTLKYQLTSEYSLAWNTQNIINQVKKNIPVDMSNYIIKKEVPMPPNLSLIKEWDFKDSEGGWQILNNIESLEAKNGYLSVISNGGDPHMEYNKSLDMKASELDYLYIRYVNVSNNSMMMEFFFSTEESPGLDEVKTIKIKVDEISDDENIWSEMYIDLNQCSSWTGTIKNIRIDPGTAAGEFRFDHIAFYKQG